MKPLLPHHAAWLDSHPHRDESWLRAMLREGFDVHHIDGDHGNDMPDNLLLIEHTDHMMLHSGGIALWRLRPGQRAPIAGRSPKPVPPSARQPTAEQCATSWQMCLAGERWIDIGRAIGFSRDMARNAARRHAKSAGHSWPPLPITLS